MLAAVNVSAGKIVASVLRATDPNAWVAFATQAQWENGGVPRDNNPFNLTDPGRGMVWRSFGQAGWYSGGAAAELHDDFAAFATLWGGAQAAAANYQREGSYGAVLAACTAGDGPTAIAAAIQSSPWSTDHYGGALAARVSAELAALFAAAAAKEASAMTEQITTFTPSRRGTVEAATRRFAAAAPYGELSPLPADGYLFDAWVAIDQPITPHGHFLRTATTPPVLVASASVTLDPAVDTVLPDPEPVTPPEPAPMTDAQLTVFREEHAAELDAAYAKFLVAETGWLVANNLPAGTGQEGSPRGAAPLAVQEQLAAAVGASILTEAGYWGTLAPGVSG